MGVIIALIVMNCQLHLNYGYCINNQIKCVDIMMSLKYQDDSPHGIMSYEEKLAASYEYCKRAEGHITEEDQLRYDSLIDGWRKNPYAGFYPWEKPGHIERIMKKTLQAQE